MVLGPSLENVGGALGRPRGSWGVLGSAVERPWERLGGPREPLGTSSGVLEGPLGLLGVPLGRFGFFWKIVEKQLVFVQFPAMEAPLGDTWACLVCSLRLWGALLESLSVLGGPGLSLGAPSDVLGIP